MRVRKRTARSPARHRCCCTSVVALLESSYQAAPTLFSVAARSAAAAPAIEHMCSSTTGFFFCGMMLEPWQYESGVTTQRNVIQSSIVRAIRAPVARMRACTAPVRTRCSAPATASYDDVKVSRNPSSSVRRSDAIGRSVPANAHEPSGETSSSSYTDSSSSAWLSSASPYPASTWPSVVGWAGLRWV